MTNYIEKSLTIFLTIEATLIWIALAFVVMAMLFGLFFLTPVGKRMKEKYFNDALLTDEISEAFKDLK